MRFGKVTRPILGIKFAPDQSVEQLGVSGVLVLDAPANGPAGKAVLLHTVYCILFVKLFLLQLARNMDSLTIYNFIYLSVEFLFFSFSLIIILLFLEGHQYFNSDNHDKRKCLYYLPVYTS